MRNLRHRLNHKGLLAFASILCAFVGNLNAAPPEPLPSQSYTIEHVQAPTIAGKLQDMIRSSGMNAELVVDRAGNRLVVRGTDETQRVVRQAITALDVPVQPKPTDKSTLQPVKIPPTKLDAVATTLQLKYASDARIKIASDKRTNQLLILAPETLQATIRDEATSMAFPKSEVAPVAGTESPAGIPTKYALHHASWQQFETQIIQLAGAHPIMTTRRNGEVAVFQLKTMMPGDTQIEVDRRDSTVTITAPTPSASGWAKLVQSFDQPPATANQVFNVVRLDKAEPAPIQKALRLLSELRGDSDVATLPAPSRRLPATTVAMQNPQAPDAAPPAGAPGNAQGTPPPANGAAPQVIEAGAGVLGDVQVEFVEELGVLVVRGSKRDVQRVRDVIKQIEMQSDVTRPEVLLHPLQHINAGAAADLVRALYDDALAPRQGQVNISSLDTPNVVLLVGRKEAVEAAKELLIKLDQPALPSAEMKIFHLRHASAVDAETTVRNFFTTNPGEDEELRPGLGARARVVADYRTNTLIVQASPRDLLQVTELVNSLDVDIIPSTQQLEIFPLKNSLAEDLVLVLQAAITPAEDGDEGRSVPSARLSIMSVDAEGNRVLDSGILTGVVLTPDPNANAIVARGPASTMPLLRELITQLDKLPGGVSTVKVFTIQHGDASGLVATLQQLFSLQQSTGTAQTGTATATGAAGPGIGPTQLTGQAESSILPLRLAVDRRTNAIIATGSPEDLAIVEALLVRLDTEGLASRITEVIWLRHATSTNVVQALQDFVTNQQSQTIRSATTPGLGQSSGIVDLLDRDLIVADEPVTNSLIISVAPRVYDMVRRVIDQLDRRPPMVLVKTILAEVTLGDGFEFGSELGIQDSLLFDRSTVSATNTLSPGFNFNNQALGNSSSAASTATRNDLGTQALSNFLVGRTSSTFGYGGFVLSAASDSINLLIRALQDANRAQILSRPQIMTLDNTEGSVFVGAQVPRINGFSINNNGFSQPLINDVQVGLILRIRPRVGADGLIVLEIDATRSALDQANAVPIGVSADGSAIVSPQILTTQAASTVTAYDGQTVVYGGLIQKERTQFSRRVPYLSSIPLLGMLFRFDQEREIRKELLAIMTPMIVSSDQDLEYVKATESSRMSWCLADLIEMHGPAGLSPGHGLWGPAIGATIYPDLQPTVDDLPSELSESPLQMHDASVIVPPGPINNQPYLEPQTSAPGRSPSPATQSPEVLFDSDRMSPTGTARPQVVPPSAIPEGFEEVPLAPASDGAFQLPPQSIQKANFQVPTSQTRTAPSPASPSPAARPNFNAPKVGDVIRFPPPN